MNLAFPVFISPIVWNMCENLHYESVYFKELHNEQEYYWTTIYRAGAAAVSTVTSINTLGSQCEAGLYWLCSIEFPPASLLQVNKTSNMKQENWNISLGGNQNFRVLLSKRCSWQQARLVHVATLFKGVVRFRSWTVLDVRTRYNVSLWTQWSLATRWKRFTFLCSI